MQKTQDGKTKSQQKMKKINDPYSILSDNQKRKEYDEKLKEQRENEKQIERQKIINETIEGFNKKLKNEYNNEAQIIKNTLYNEENKTQNNTNQKEQKVYTKEDYIRDYNKRLRKLKFENWKKNIIINLKVLIIMCIILIFIWLFPPTRKFLVNMYEENIAIQTIVEIFAKIIDSVKNV